jgi:hypothetical protein
MTSSALHDSELIDCAKANSKYNIETVAERCGYGSDIAAFERELKRAGDSMGLQINSFKDLIEDKPENQEKPGVEIRPDTKGQL